MRTPSLKLFLLSGAVVLLSALLEKLLFGFGHFTGWLICEWLFQSVFVFALFAFCRSLTVVLTVQFVLNVLFHVTNNFKLSFLGTPILPSDYFLIEDLYHIVPHSSFLIGLFAVLAVLIGCFIFVFLKSSRWPGRRIAFAAPAILILGCILFFPKIYVKSFNYVFKDELFQIPFLIKEREATIGLTFSYSYDFASMLSTRSENPPRENVEKSLADLQVLPGKPTSNPHLNRNVYIILTESFWDPVGVALKDIPKEVPLLDPRFRDIWQSLGQRYFLSPMFGGGTANVEFEILCGIPFRSVAKGIVFQVGLVKKPGCMPEILSELGYKTFAFHPFEKGYFNRSTAFRLLGFQKFDSIEDFVPDAEPGIFLEDKEFISQSIQRARERANGKPFLAYMMTFAGHWPFAWVTNYGDRQIHLAKAAQSSDLELLERHLNVNLIASEVLARTIAEIRIDDPRAIIMIAGDHQPALAKDVEDEPGDIDALTNIDLFKTPLIILGGENPQSPLGKIVPAYRVGQEILNRLGLPVDRQRQFAWFHHPTDWLIRPLQSSATLVKTDAQSPVTVCSPDIKNYPCTEMRKWLTSVHQISADLAHGEQFTNQILGFVTNETASDFHK